MPEELEHVAKAGQLAEFRVYYWSVKCHYSDQNPYCIDYINYYMNEHGPTNLESAKEHAQADGWRDEGGEIGWTCVACRHRYSLM